MDELITEPKEIIFSEEWDKLKKENLKVGAIILSNRSYSVNKHIFWKLQVGKDFYIKLLDKRIAIGTVDLVTIGLSSNLSIESIKESTYSTWTRKDYEKWIVRCHGVKKIAQIRIYMKVKELLKR